MASDALTNKDEKSGESKCLAASSPLVKLAMHLMNIESLSGQEQAMAVALQAWLEQRGWIVELQEVPPQKSTVNAQVRHNVYARPPGSEEKPGGPRVLFNSHIDTVRTMRGWELEMLGRLHPIFGLGFHIDSHASPPVAIPPSMV